MNHTTNYNLNQWEASDRVQRADFNADNAKIDAAIKAVDGRVDGLGASKADKTALAAKAEIVTGSYTGNGAASRFLNLGFTPKAVLVFTSYGLTYDSSHNGMRSCYGGLVLPGLPLAAEGHICMKIMENGVQTYHTVIGENPASFFTTNEKNITFYYIAFK